LNPDLERLMRSVKPTIDAGGRLILLSRSDKLRPQSLFKTIYRSALEGKNSYKPLFHPWHARPDRDEAWYAEQVRESLANTTALDFVHEQYPATDVEALAAPTLSKRLPAQWLSACFEERRPLTPANYPCDVANRRRLEPPALPGLVVYQWPAPPAEVQRGEKKARLKGRHYAIGADPALGNPNSDDSAAVVLDCSTGNQVAELVGKFEPEVFGQYVAQLAAWYGRALVLPERNAMGVSLVSALRDAGARVMCGKDGNPGWQTTATSKATLYNTLAEHLRAGDAGIASRKTLDQLLSIEAATLSAPEGLHDDRAMAYALATTARAQAGPTEYVVALPIRPKKQDPNKGWRTL
jgi:hypothetical protein